MAKTNPKNNNKTNPKPPGTVSKAGTRVKSTERETVKPDNPPVNARQPKIKNQHQPQTNQPVSETKETVTQNTSPDKNMDVHHHPQLEHKPKPWKEYLLEGFMIFIAVMMGFIAENVRGYITDNEHVNQLTSQLVHDLKADTLQLNTVYRSESLIVKYNDTLVNLLQQPFEKADTRRIQKLIANSHSMWLFSASTGAISAIKNELHLKQFSNSEVIGLFSNYEAQIALLHIGQDINLQYQRIYLDPFMTQHFTAANMIAAFDKSSMPTSQMINLTKADLDRLAADMVLIRIISKGMLRDSKAAKGYAAETLDYVVKRYHPEDAGKQ